MDILFILLGVLLGLSLWFIIGLIVLVSVDKDELILNWFRSCPKTISWWAKPLMFSCWPALVYMYVKDK